MHDGAPNPALESLDGETINNNTGNVQTRITELHQTYYPAQGHRTPPQMFG